MQVESVLQKHCLVSSNWLALIGSELVIVHIFLFLVSKFGKRSTEKQKNYGALVLPSFEIFLLILALPCLLPGISYHPQR